MQAFDEASAFLAVFEDLVLDYMVVGGMAAILYGEVRYTRDLDLVVALNRRELTRLHAAFDPERFYVPPLEVLWEEADRLRGGHFNLYDNATDFRADVYMAGDGATDLDALAAPRRVDIGPLVINVAPPEYVIAHKLRFRREGGGDHHVRDVRAMLAVSGDAIDRALLADLVHRLGVRAQWDEVVGAR